MHTTHKISFRQALQMVDTAILEAEKIHRHIAVAVAGPEGELLCFIRMDGASPAAAVIAQNKAYTAARDRKSTREMGEFMTTQGRPQAYWGDKGITGFGGGMPVFHGAEVIGGIGVSGLSEEEDERICNAMVKAVFAK
jgi:glc operon protein GlcG